MNKLLKILMTMAAAAIMSACGGGGADAGTPLFGNPAAPCPASAASSATPCTTSTAAAIDVLASSVQVDSGGDTVTVTAIVKGPGNVSLGGAPISFAADSGTLTKAATATDATGVATATFSAGADRSNRTVNVTATSGSAVGSIALQVVGTKLAYTGVTTVPLAGQATIGVSAKDSNGVGIAGVSFAVTSSLNNTLAAPSITTDAQGNATVGYTAVTAGADNVSFTGGGSTLTQTIQVSAANFAFVTPAAGVQIPVSTPQSLTVLYLVNGAAQAGKTINFSATAGVVTNSAVTDGSGHATVSISSVTASPAVVQASVVGAAAQATLPIVFVAQAPAKLVLQVSPTAIGPNSGSSTTQQAKLLATVTDANGNPVTGATVAFNRIADPSGGNLSQASATTDSGGQASVQYIAGASTTGNNGVQIQANVLGNPAVASLASLTVNQSALFIALGTGNVISNLDEQTYKKDWTVYVTDANGVAVPNIDLTIKVLPVQYMKGVLIFGTAWTIDPTSLHTCANEDNGGGDPSKAYNGVLDPGEDFNGDGVLQPGNVISVTTAQTPTASATGIAKTDATGRATITLLYAESYVPWIKVKLVAQAIVSGTESSNQAIFVVPGASSDFTSQTNPPAGTTSPFGVNACNVPN
jgi:Bacterial Ig-like domain (group 1)